MNNWCICWFFYAYSNEMHGSRSKIHSKNFVKQRCAEGFNFGVKGLKYLALPLTRIIVNYSSYLRNV
jgi:hypothetical protein